MKPNEHTVQPIIADDDTIARALQDANIPALMMSIIHITRDTSLLDGAIRPKAVINTPDRQGGLSEAEQAEIRERAFVAIKAYRDAGCPELAPLPVEVLTRMSSFVAGEQIPDEYLPMMYTDMRFDVEVTKPRPWTDGAADDRRKDFRVVVIGAGPGGILAGIKLDEMGIDYTIFEKEADVGGTWRDNTYPGCRVDSVNHFFSYSFETNPNWSQHFSARDELYPYFSQVAEKYRIKEKTRFETEVEDLTWLEADSEWRVTVRRADGTREQVRCNAIITAVGQLSRPKFPEIPGRDTFAGRSCHTHGYDRSIEIAGKKVVVVGSAASAVQMVPELAKTAGTLTVFQRTPHWYWPTPEYQGYVADGMKWLLGHVPAYSSWYRFLIFWGLTDGIRHWFEIDPNWPDQHVSVNEINEGHRLGFTQFIKETVNHRPDLVAKLIPTYPPFSDRILLNNGSYLRAMTQDNVELVNTGITRIDEGGVYDGEGNYHEADVIIYATGFHSGKFLFPMKIVGRDGLVINDYWDGEAHGYLGITVPSFPNFFMIWGPGTAGGTGGSNLFFAECHMRFICSSIHQMIENDLAAIEPRIEVTQDYLDRFRTEVDRMVWTSPAVKSWYKNESGRVITNLPWRMIDYWNWTKASDMADFVMTSRSRVGDLETVDTQGRSSS